MSGRTYVGWDEIERACDKAVEAMRRTKYRPNTVLAVARGGLAPAVVMAHRLGISDVHAVAVSTYDDRHGKKVRDARLTNSRDVLLLQELRNAPVLIVDDVIETGATIELLRRTLRRAKVFAVATKGRAGPLWADYTGSDYPPDQWLVFPWEQSGNQRADHAIRG